MLKNTEFQSISICYAGFLNFKINLAGTNEVAAFEWVFLERLQPFFTSCSTPFNDHDYEIFLYNQQINFETSGAYSVKFFIPKQDNKIEDFSEGLLRIEEGVRHIYNPKNGSLFKIFNRKIHIYYASPNTLLKDLQRVLKQLIVSEVESQRGFILHASAFSYDNKAFCFVGEKGQGKTTCLLEAIKIKGAKYITNDRLPVLYRAGKFFAASWFEELRIIEEALNPIKKVVSVSSMFSNDKISTQLVPIKKIFFPIISGDGIGNEKKILTEQCLSPEDPQRPKWLGIMPLECDNKFENFQEDILMESFYWSFSEREQLNSKILNLIRNV